MSSVSNTITTVKNTVQPYARPTAAVLVGGDGVRRLVHAYQTRGTAQVIAQQIVQQAEQQVAQPAAGVADQQPATSTRVGDLAAVPAKPAKLSYDVLSRFSFTPFQQAIVGTAEIVVAVYLGVKK